MYVGMRPAAAHRLQFLPSMIRYRWGWEKHDQGARISDRFEPQGMIEKNVDRPWFAIGVVQHQKDL